MLRAIRLISPKIRCFSVVNNSKNSEVMVPDNNESNSLVKSLVNEYHNEIIIKDLFKTHSQLQNTSLTQWRNCLEKLQDYNFHLSDCLSMISMYPELLKIPPKKFESNIARWFDCHLGLVYFQFLLINCPFYLQINITNIEKRIPYLRQIAPTKRLLLRLLIQCPNIMYEDWDLVKSKIDYLLNEMRVDTEEVFRSIALSKSFDHIKMRHQLLDRCGLFVPQSKWIHKRIKSEKKKFINPHLKRIVDNADISFARKIAKISEEEYVAFLEIWENKLEEDSDSDEEYEL